MKKIISLLLAISMLLSVASSAFAMDATGIEANILESTNIVNVTGQFDGNAGDVITMILVDDNNTIKHIQETELEKDNTYRAKFKYKGADFESLKLRVRQGDEDITNTVISAIAEKEAIKFNININNANGKTELTTKIKKYYNVEDKTYTVMLAYYDADNRLLDTYIQDTKNLEFDVNASDVAEYDIPENATNVRVFIWDKTTTIVPLTNKRVASTKEVSVLMIGNSFTDDSEAYLKDIAAADGVNLIVESATYGGGGFKEHWETWSSENYSQTDAANNPNDKTLQYQEAQSLNLI